MRPRKDHFRTFLARTALLCLAGLSPRLAHAYPEFIGYGYTTCITCHYNGQGGGPLTQYGRAVWSSEIASRMFYPASVTNEAMGDQSGFLGSVELPRWFQPHVKYRGLNVWQNPGSKDKGTSKFYQMQEDAGFSSQWDSSGSLVTSVTWGRVLPPGTYGLGDPGINHIQAREYFLRAKIASAWYVYAGLLQKVFGLNNVDHTSYQRRYQGFQQAVDDQDGYGGSQGIAINRETETSGLWLNYFIGNPFSPTKVRQKGGSFMGEIEVAERTRLGASVSASNSDVLGKRMAAIHLREGIATGSALLLEYGIIEDKPVTNDGSDPVTSTGSYSLLQSFVNLSRGFNLKTTIERDTAQFRPEVPESWRFATGFVIFPAPRFEIRTEVINLRQISTVSAPDDAWAIQGQIHVSL